MKILHVIAGMRKAAGTSVFAGEVANELVAQGHEVAIAVADPKCEDCYKLDPRVKLIGFDDVVVGDYDVIHIHALWDPRLNKIAKQIHSPTPRIAPATQLASLGGYPTSNSHSPKLVWSPHGMLTPWALKNKWWKKLLGLALYQYWSLRNADLIHVTAQSEVEDIKRLGLKNEIVIAPLGVRIKETNHHSPTPTHNSNSTAKTLLFVSRVQRKKGLPNLLEAWARLPKDLTKDWTIRIVGPDQDNHTAELMAQCERLGISYANKDGEFHSPTPTHNSHSMQPQVAFVGPKYDADLDAEYSKADLFVLPTHSENFGSVVIEALARSVPVICTKEAPWKELETHKCGWWIDDSVDALVQALKEALPLHCTPTTLSHTSLVEMGKNGLELVKAKYDWRVVGKTLADAYLSISQGCEKGRCSECAELYDTCSP